MIRILHVIAALNAGGVEKVLYDYLNYFDMKEYKIDIACYSFYNGLYRKKFESIGCKIYEIPSKKKLYKSWKKLNSVIKNNHYDIVHIHQDEKSIIPLFCSFINKVPVRIIHAHNSNHGGFIVAINRYFARQIAFLIANGYFACGLQVAKDFYGQNKLNRKVYIMPNAIDCLQFKYNALDRISIRKEYDILDNEILIGCVGRLSIEKNHYFLIEIMNEIRKTSNKYKMIFWGDGDLKQSIIEKIKNNNLSKHIIVAGAREDIYRCYNSLDLLVMPSLYEGMPLTPIEGLSNGLPVLLSDTITKEINISKQITYLSLKSGPVSWANYILNNSFSRIENISIGNYNLKNATIQLQHEYATLLNIYKR